MNKKNMILSLLLVSLFTGLSLGQTDKQYEYYRDHFDQ